MSPEGFLPGYLIYLLVIFLPGIGFGELFQIWKYESSFMGRLALAFGLGLSIDTIIFLVRTSKIAGLVGIDLATVYFILAIGLAALLASVVWKKGFSFPTKIRRDDIALLVLMLIQGAILLLFFEKYPIFPQYQSQDFQNHVGYTLSLISGTTTSIPGGLLYFGVHYQLASSLLLVGGEPLVTVQRTMAILILFSPLLFFLGGKRIFSNQASGVVTALVYTLSGTIWYAMVFDTGLYPNFFGILSALFLIISLTFVVEAPRSMAWWAVFLLADVNAYMSHYTLLTVLPSAVLVLVFQLALKKPNAKNYIAPVVALVLPALIPFLIFPNLAQHILFLASSGGGTVSGSTTLSQAFTSIPVLHYLAIIIYNDFALAALIFLSAFYLYKSFFAKDAIFFLPIVWFLALLIVAPVSVSAWRFSDEALVPLVLMASYGLYSFFPGRVRRSKMTARAKGRRESGRLYMYALIVILFGALLIGSYGQNVVLDSLSDSSQFSQAQNYVYQAISWLGSNTPSNSSYLSVSDWRFTYTNLIIGRQTQYTYTYLPWAAIALAKNVSAQYIIVTNFVTAAVPSYSGLFPWNNFPAQSNSNLTLVYTNPDVRIYDLYSS
jgi:hypothetical protein